MEPLPHQACRRGAPSPTSSPESWFCLHQGPGHQILGFQWTCPPPASWGCFSNWASQLATLPALPGASHVMQESIPLLNLFSHNSQNGGSASLLKPD